MVTKLWFLHIHGKDTHKEVPEAHNLSTLAALGSFLQLPGPAQINSMYVHRLYDHTMEARAHKTVHDSLVDRFQRPLF